MRCLLPRHQHAGHHLYPDPCEATALLGGTASRLRWADRRYRHPRAVVQHQRGIGHRWPARSTIGARTASATGDRRAGVRLRGGYAAARRKATASTCAKMAVIENVYRSTGPRRRSLCQTAAAPAARTKATATSFVRNLRVTQRSQRRLSRRRRRERLDFDRGQRRHAAGVGGSTTALLGKAIRAHHSAGAGLVPGVPTGLAPWARCGISWCWGRRPGPRPMRPRARPSQSGLARLGGRGGPRSALANWLERRDLSRRRGLFSTGSANTYRTPSPTAAAKRFEAHRAARRSTPWSIGGTVGLHASRWAVRRHGLGRRQPPVPADVLIAPRCLARQDHLSSASGGVHRHDTCRCHNRRRSPPGAGAAQFRVWHQEPRGDALYAGRYQAAFAWAESGKQEAILPSPTLGLSDRVMTDRMVLDTHAMSRSGRSTTIEF